MSSGGKGSRNSKGSRSSSGNANTHTQNKSDYNHNEEKDLASKTTKQVAPTAEQLRIAQMIDSSPSEHEKLMGQKINQVVQVTGVSTDVAIVALHDSSNDVNQAIDALLEGDAQGEWTELTKKKKKPPGSKSKDELESNKENRRIDSRDRSQSKSRGGTGPPRFRGRGGGRGGREEISEGVGRGSGARRGGRMANGMGASRGRGSRGRGSAGMRTFQRQPPGFTNEIDTWGVTPDRDIGNTNMQIDNWDDEEAAVHSEDWDSEWTGSLDQTTVFAPSTMNAPSPDALPSSPELNDGSNFIDDAETISSTIINSNLNSSISSLGMGVVTTSPGYPNVVSNSISPGLGGESMRASHQLDDPIGGFNSAIPSQTTLDFAALLQKAAPHSTLSGALAPLSQNSLAPTPLAPDGTPSLLGQNGNDMTSRETGGNVMPVRYSQQTLGSSSIDASLSNTNNMGSSMVNNSMETMGKSLIGSSTMGTSSMNNSIFSNSVSSCLPGSLGMGKNLSQSQVMNSRQKSQRPRVGHPSKIPSSAVEMPEVTMAALDMQFTGLEFGTESFDFNSDVKSLGQSMAQQSLGSQNMSAQSMSQSGMSQQNMSQQNLSQQGLSQQNMSQQNMSQQSLSQQNMAQQNLSQQSASNSVNSRDVMIDVLPSSAKSTKDIGVHNSSLSQSTSNYSTGSSTVSNSTNNVGANTYQSSNASNSSNVANNSQSNYSNSFSSSNTPYHQNSYVNTSSLASISVPKGLSALKDTQQSYTNDTTPSSLSESISAATNPGSSSNVSVSSLSSLANSAGSTVQSQKSSVPVSSYSSSKQSSLNTNSLQSSVVQQGQHQTSSQHLTQQHHHLQQQQQQQHPSLHAHSSTHQQTHSTQHTTQPQHSSQQPHSIHTATGQQQQQQQQMLGPSPYVTPTPATLQTATLPPAFYNMQQPMYSFEDLQLFQQRMPHMQAPTSLPTAREGSLNSAASYSVADASKFRTDQNSSPVQSSINQQGGAAAGTYITAAGNAGLPPPFYMYHNMAAVPSSFPQYGAPAIIQIPPSTHTGTTNTQFPGPPKLPYGGTSTYYDNLSQTQDYKTGYGSGGQVQSKAGSSTTGSVSNTGSDMSGYKTHLGKVNRTYEKQTFHTGTPPPYNLGSATSPMAAAAGGYPPMFIPTMPANPQHQTLIHHQMHQDGPTASGQRAAATAGQTKTGSKGNYSASYWTN